MEDCYVLEYNRCYFHENLVTLLTEYNTTPPDQEKLTIYRPVKANKILDSLIDVYMSFGRLAVVYQGVSVFITTQKH